MTWKIKSNGYLYTFAAKEWPAPLNAERFSFADSARRFIEQMDWDWRTRHQLEQMHAEQCDVPSVGQGWSYQLDELARMLVDGRLTVVKTRLPEPLLPEDEDQVTMWPMASRSGNIPESTPQTGNKPLESPQAFEKRYAKELADLWKDKNYTEVSYLYADGKSVAGARFKIYDQSDNRLVAKGEIRAQPSIRQRIPNATTNFRVEFYADPKLEKYLEKPRINPELRKERPGWLERMWPAVQSEGCATWDGVQAEFSENPTFGQIITNTIITTARSIVQENDLYDTVHTVRELLWEKRIDDYGLWKNLAVLCVGRIPVTGPVHRSIMQSALESLPLFHGNCTAC